MKHFLFFLSILILPFLAYSRIPFISPNDSNYVTSHALGVHLGSHKDVVKGNLESNGYNLVDAGESLFINDFVDFGGYRWNSVKFNFYNDELYQINFINPFYPTNNDDKITLFREIVSKYRNKYSSNLVQKYQTDKILIIGNREIQINIEFKEWMGRNTVYVSYEFLDIKHAKEVHDLNEL